MSDIERRICDAFRWLVNQRPIDSIGIQAICDRADVSRKTFSRHFGTIQAVAERQIDFDFVRPVVDINRLISADLLVSQAFILRNLKLFQEHKDYYCSVINEYGASWFESCFAAHSVSMEFRPYDYLSLGESELSFVENHFARSVASVFCWWIERGMDVPAEEVSRMVDDWVYARFRELQKS